MPLIVHRSTDPDRLADAVADLLATPPPDPLAIDRIAVHSRGVETWLSMHIARRNRIFGAATFHRPEDLVARLAADTLGQPLDTSWNSAELLWALLATLPELLDDPRLEPVHTYLHADGPSERTLRLVTLCQRLAPVFQAYGSYRPTLVRAWQSPTADEPWEAPVWRALEQRLGATHLTAWADRLSGHTLPEQAARNVLFTVTTLPPLALQILADLAGTETVHLFALHPSPVAWTRDEAEHPLLWSMGTLAADFRTVASACPAVHRLIPGATPPRDTLLHALQADLHDDTLRPFVPAATDASLQLHVCSSPLRQVQVLRDTLLRLVDTAGIELRDIVVMTPDVEVFAPLVQAVFHDGAPSWRDAPTHDAGFPTLPFRLADRGVRAQNQAAEALLALLELAESRLEAPEVVAFLALDVVRERFGLSADDLPRVRELVVASGARWGADASHRAAESLPADPRFTWRFAIDRLLLGQALATPELDVVLGHAPGCDLESLEDRRILGGLVDALETLLEQVAALRTPRTPADWFAHLARSLRALLTSNSDRAWQVLQVDAGLEDLSRQAAASGMDDLLDLRTIRSLVSGRFSAREPGRGFLAGPITVCQLVPLRSIPFQVVCLLGMDESAFPRIQSRPGYDRMALAPQIGDRDARVDDRALFLEALQSARHTLVVTCTGRSEVSGRQLPLSVPVAELLDTVAAMGGREAVDHITVRHALQPWSPDNFRGGTGSLDARMLHAARAWREGRALPTPVRTVFADSLPPAPDLPAELTIDQFVRFWMHPPTALVRRRLGLSLWNDEVDLRADLPLRLDGLEIWRLKHALIEEGRHDDPPLPSFADRASLGTTLPMGSPGQVLLQAQTDDVEAFLRHARPLLAQPADPIDVRIPGPPELTGRIGDLYAAGRVLLQPGRVHPRQVLALWIHHLALHTAGWTGTSTLLGPKGGRRLPPLPIELASELLGTLRAGYQRGLDEPLLFWPDPSHGAVIKGTDGMAPFYGSKDSWTNRKDHVRLVDSWILGPGRNPFHPRFRRRDLACPIAVAKRVWLPLLDHEEQVST